MTSPQNLTWNLHGNDQLSGVLERLDRNIAKLGRTMDGAGREARELGTSMSRVQAPAGRLQAVTQRLSGYMSTFKGHIMAVAGWLRTMAVTAGVALLSAASAAGVFGLKMAAANEQAAVSFEVILGNAQKAKEFLAGLMKFAAETPFELPQLRDAASRLLAVGTAASDVIPLLTVLGDATAGMGTGAMGIERAVTALTQMRQKGKVTGEEMLQLTEAGIPAWETLAAAIGKSVPETQKLATKGKINVQTLFDAIEKRTGTSLKRLSGMMSRQSQTLTGLFSTFKDNASQALATFMEPAIPAVKGVLDFLSKAIPTTFDMIRTQSSRIAGIFKGSDVPDKVMSSLRKLKDDILPKLRESWDKIVKTIQDHKEGLEKFGRFVADVLIPLLGTSLVTTIDTITLAFQGVIIITSKVVDAIRFFTALFIANLGFIIVAADKTFGWIPGLGPKLHKAREDFEKFADSVMRKLNSLDGKTIDINFVAHLPKHGGRMDAVQSFDTGGTVPGPVGSPQLAVVHGGERVLTPGQQSSGGILGYLVVRHENSSGVLMREELLALKRQLGGRSLGLA